MFENIVVRNGKTVTIKLLITISDLQFKQILIQKDHNIHTYSLFCVVVLAEENLRKPLLLVTYRNQVFLYFHFKLANKKVPKNKNSAHFPLIDIKYRNEI